jgi:tRNA(fMet)-specific endonuclease VapC
MEKNRIILDTSAYADFLKGDPAIKTALQQADEIFLNPVILGELLAGFSLGRDEKRNRSILQNFLSSPRVRMIEIDEETSERYAAIFKYLRGKGAPVPTNDLWIAASAMQYGLKILTTDKHFLRLPQIITDYYQTE